jgi:hypothetical protein
VLVIFRESTGIFGFLLFRRIGGGRRYVDLCVYDILCENEILLRSLTARGIL